MPRPTHPRAGVPIHGGLNLNFRIDAILNFVCKKHLKNEINSWDDAVKYFAAKTENRYQIRQESAAMVDEIQTFVNKYS